MHRDVPPVLVFHSCAGQFFKGFAFLCNFCHFCSFYHNFEHPLHMFCVIIFQAQSFASAICKLFSSHRIHQKERGRRQESYLSAKHVMVAVYIVAE